MIGGFVERRHDARILALVYVAGGLIGQTASVIAEPDLVSSGASQALMAVCGAAVIVRAPIRSKLFVLLVVAIQAALDMHVAAKIKAGHGIGFAAGLLIGVLLLCLSRTQYSHIVPDNVLQDGEQVQDLHA